jgi:hypothetical protein
VHHERSRYTFITYAPSKKKIIWMDIVMWITLPGDFTHVDGIRNVCSFHCKREEMSWNKWG